MSRRYRRAAAGASFNPLSIPNLLHWWDISDASTLTLSGSDITTVSCKNSSGVNLLAANPTYPSVEVGQIGTTGLSCARIDVANLEHFYTSANINIGARTYIGVFKEVTNQAAPTFVMSNAANYFQAGRHTAVSGNHFTYYNTLNNHGVGYTTDSSIYSWTFSSSATTFHKNGVAGTPGVTSGATAVNTYLSIGRYRAASTGQMDGYFGELFIIDGVISDANRVRLQNYLGDKWGITVS